MTPPSPLSPADCTTSHSSRCYGACLTLSQGVCLFVCLFFVLPNLMDYTSGVVIGRIAWPSSPSSLFSTVFGTPAVLVDRQSHIPKSNETTPKVQKTHPNTDRATPRGRGLAITRRYVSSPEKTTQRFRSAHATPQRDVFLTEQHAVFCFFFVDSDEDSGKQHLSNMPTVNQDTPRIRGTKPQISE